MQNIAPLATIMHRRIYPHLVASVLPLVLTASNPEIPGFVVFACYHARFALCTGEEALWRGREALFRSPNRYPKSISGLTRPHLFDSMSHDADIQ